jgi:hypothetical protein
MGQIGGQIRDRYGIGPKGPVYKGATCSGVDPCLTTQVFLMGQHPNIIPLNFYILKEFLVQFLALYH